MNQVVTFTATEANAASWVWDFGDGTTATGRSAQHSFTQLGGPNATLTVTGDGTNTIGTSSSIIAFTIVDPAVLYLNDRRFEVRTSWVSGGQGTSGVGTAVQLTPDTGYFWFFYPANLEVVVKVLDACTVDGYFWVFGGGLTNLGVQMTVLDTFTGVTKVYSNTDGHAFQPIQDTRFEACPAVTGGSAITRAAAAPSVTISAPTPATPVTGDSVSFTATPTGFADDSAVTYMWDFGDSCPPVVPGCSGGATSGPATNTHTYQGPGTFTVNVSASQGGQTATALQTVTVTDASPTIPHPSAAYTLVGASAGRNNVWSAPINQAITFNAIETHAASYTWDFGDGSPQTGATVTHTFTTAGSPQVILTVVGDDTNTSGTTAATIRFAITDPYTLLLDNGRFAIQAAWSSAAQQSSGYGTATALTTDTGYFWFFTSSNTEVVIKALDACSFDGHFWIFGSGLTNLGVVLTVTDTQSGTTMQYTSTDGSAFQPIQDFVSFSACGGS
jgi:PKD repeat protein